MVTSFLSHDTDRSTRSLDARADDTDARDFVYEPTIALLPGTLDRRPLAPKILDQGQEGACVGFALAAVINISLARQDEVRPARRRSATGGAGSLASARMLYEMARRYDEWKGEGYSGTSPRGAMKAWHHVGAASEAAWPLDSREREWTPERADDARSRPLGAYYRVLDSDPLHVQAAVLEADAVLVSLWVHSGWRHDQLLAPARGAVTIKRIDSRPGGRSLHAVAIVGYTPDGLIVQNSWGRRWGTGGFALLAYDDWFANRQDAWIARPGPRTNDSQGRARIFLAGFAGEAGAPSRVDTSAEGLDIPAGALPFFINTGDQGGLDGTHRLKTRIEELPGMAAKVREQQTVDGHRHVMLYAHGGLDAETEGVRIASRIFTACRASGQTAYFFVWETGTFESVLGLLRSRDDAAGPEAVGFSIPEILGAIKKGAANIGRAVQKAIGAASAGAIRPIWKEMTGRAEGASASRGGARLFTGELLKAMRDDDRGVPYVLHLVGHSAGAIYLSFLWDHLLRTELTDPVIAGTGVTLGSIHLMAPALSVADAEARFMAGGALPVARKNFRVYMLGDEKEQTDNIGVYPSSLLTYVADHLQARKGRVPILGIGSDFRKRYRNSGGPWPVPASPGTERHGQFDDEGHEIDTIIEEIAAGKYV